jgi:ParB/RepB/Spo0J family partition protein
VTSFGSHWGHNIKPNLLIRASAGSFRTTALGRVVMEPAGGGSARTARQQKPLARRPRLPNSRPPAGANMTTGATAVQPTYVTLPIERIHESTTNPRQLFNDLQELAASIRTHGVLQPILVRPLRKDFELIVGARRLRAARLAGLTSVPAQVKPLDDRSAREVQIIENLQRQDVHPLEEADGYKTLLDSTPSCTIDEIAAKVGKSKAYVYQRLALTRLVPQVREVVAADALPLSYALKLAALDAATQLEALERCFRPLGGDRKYSREWLEPIGRLQEWLGEHARLDPRSEQAKVLLPELAAQVEEAEQTHAATVLAVSTLHFHTDRREPKPILARSWKLAEGKHKCQYARPAVIELGDQQGRFIQVCIEKKKCTKHWTQQQSSANVSGHRAEEERRRAEGERRRALFEQHIRPNTLKALAAATQRRAFKGSIFLEVLKQLRPSSRDEEFVALVGEPAKLPPARFAQACIVAIALGLAWNPDHLAKFARRFGVNTRAIERATLRDARNDETEPATD